MAILASVWGTHSLHDTCMYVGGKLPPALLASHAHTPAACAGHRRGGGSGLFL